MKFLVALFLVFLTLKLTGFIEWSWWQVTIPLWGVFGIVLIAALVAALISAEILKVVSRGFRAI